MSHVCNIFIAFWKSPFLGESVCIMKRIEWIDNAKVLGIFFVVLGHSGCSKWMVDYIYSFHMPLFFFLSGVIFKNLNLTTISYLKKLSASLLVPYLFFSLVSYLFWVFIGRKFGADAGLDISIFKPIIGIFYSVGKDGWMIHNTPLWFLTCLFVTSTAYFLIDKYVNGDIKVLVVVFIIMIIGLFWKKMNIPRFPWGINVMPFSLIFFALGYFFQKYRHYLKCSKMFCTFIMVIVLAISVSSHYYNGRVDLNSLIFNNYLVFLISALSGIATYSMAASLIPYSRMMQFIGMNTLTIFALHGIGFSMVKGFMVFILGLDLALLNGDLWLNVLVSISVILFLSPVAFMLNRFMPAAVGRKQI
ncbi:MAG: hypothetical protein D6B28_04355 [Gammaproteobacteria bacterium]|nr:MAG: hypothetical protein D6B28_04355 [Gammaproteobacteria bacterium]